jgi:hypothetical protein
VEFSTQTADHTSSAYEFWETEFAGCETRWEREGGGGEWEWIGKGGVLGNGLGRCVSWYGLLFDESVTCFGGLLHVYALGFGLILGLYFGLHYAVSRCYNIVTVVLFLFCTFI